MTTLISGETAKRDYRKCDEACYNAKGPVCTCVCGGMNHGKGLAGAVQAMNSNLLSLVRDQQAGLLNFSFPQAELLVE